MATKVVFGKISTRQKFRVAKYPRGLISKITNQRRDLWRWIFPQRDYLEPIWLLWLLICAKFITGSKVLVLFNCIHSFHIWKHHWPQRLKTCRIKNFRITTGIMSSLIWQIEHTFNNFLLYDSLRFTGPPIP